MTASLLELAWLARLRWLLALAQIAILALAWRGAVDLVVPPVVAALVVGLASNVALTAALRRRAVGEWGIAATLGLDAVLLTTFLAAAGGASNPFVTLYVLPPVLAAALASRRTAWAVVAVTGLGYTALLALGPEPSHQHGHEAMNAHTRGMFAAWALLGPLVVAVVLRARQALAVAERQTAEAREVRARAERLTALATLAAGASHELSTPLGTILVAAREIERTTADDRARADARTIEGEVLRCRDVLAELSADAGANRAEEGEWIAVRDLLDETLDPPPPRPVAVDAGDRPEALVLLPVRPVVLALRRLVGNACDATPVGEVALFARLEGARLTLGVRDGGAGMEAAALARAKEPFFTTKSTGRGLGLFYADAVARELGGTLDLTSEAGVGTVAELVVTVPVRETLTEDA